MALPEMLNLLLELCACPGGVELFVYQSVFIMMIMMIMIIVWEDLGISFRFIHSFIHPD